LFLSLTEVLGSTAEAKRNEKVSTILVRKEKDPFLSSEKDRKRTASS
jgi:hypothetical protein